MARDAQIAPAPQSPITALTPRGPGCQFVVYGDCCSGIPGARHETTFASVNDVVRRLSPRPDLICFLGDEVRGLAVDTGLLRDQWRHWFETEMAWLDRAAIPLYHSTGNHTTYDTPSEAVFREVLAHLPHTGPPGQEGLSYFVRSGGLLLVFVNTMWSGLGDGRVETVWLDRVLAANADAKHKFVLGHHPAYPVNGFAGDYQRNPLGRPRSPRCDRLPLRAHHVVRCAGPRRGPAGHDRRSRHTAVDAGGRRVPSLRSGRG